MIDHCLSRLLMRSLFWLATATAAMSRSGCSEALAKIWEDVDQLDAVDLTIARLRLVPYYRSMCQRQSPDWDELERALEHRRRTLEPADSLVNR